MIVHRKVEIVDGVANVGFVGTNSEINREFIPTTIGTYTVGESIGGLLTFADVGRAGIGTGYLVDTLLLDKTGSKFQAVIVLFDSNPASSTITDKTTVVVHPSDMGRIIRTIAVTPGEYATVSGASIADVEIGRMIGMAGGATTLYAALILDQATVTFTGVNDVILSLGYAKD